MNNETFDKMNTSLLMALAALVVVTATGCFNVEGEERVEGVLASHGLGRLGSCDEVERYAKDAAIERMTARLEAQLVEMERWWDWSDDFDGDDDMAGAEASADADADADVGGGSSGGYHSETNTQESGVDEADLVKTDGDWIFVLSEGQLVIVDAGADGQLDEASRVEVGGYPEELLLYGDLAVVFASVGADDVSAEIRQPEGQGDDWGDGWAEPGWDEEYPYGSAGYTRIALIDIADRAVPVTVRTIEYAGSYVTSRRVDGGLRVVLSTGLPALEVPTYVDWWEFESLPESFARAAMRRAVSERIKDNKEIIEAATFEEIMPRKLDVIVDAAEEPASQPIAECGDFYGPETPAGAGLLTVVSLDLDDPRGQQTDISVFGDQGLVYASSESLYLTTSRDYVFEAWESGLWEEETSGIHKFDIATTPTEALYVATGTAPGRMLNQFCLGEHEGFLRVGTTTGAPWDPETLDNHLLVFGEEAGELALVGSLDGIGSGEEIYAARFLGDRGFMV
ncbi:MAG: beta-propeller domain-containing protein, partial [Deltaproteobacteria bacterium]|nr:beta-propeller domain-containing protein [Deltaproteobacteria bacterium]